MDKDLEMRLRILIYKIIKSKFYSNEEKCKEIMDAVRITTMRV